MEITSVMFSAPLAWAIAARAPGPPNPRSGPYPAQERRPSLSNTALAAGGVSVEPLFRPAVVGGLALRNRLVMAPMTRAFSPGGVPGEDVARYYQRRAAGGVGLVITEG